MAIEKYTSHCLVIESFDQGENDRVYKLFTREFGMVIVHAKSIRKLGSKLRAHVEAGSTSLVTLVKGRDTWRLVGAESTEKKDLINHEVIKIIKRFIRGEGEHKALYDRLSQFCSKFSLYDKNKSSLLLYYIILVDLGYADARAIGAKTIKEYISWNMEDLYTHLLLAHKSVRSHVMEVLKETQL